MPPAIFGKRNAPQRPARVMAPPMNSKSPPPGAETTAENDFPSRRQGATEPSSLPQILFMLVLLLLAGFHAYSALPVMYRDLTHTYSEDRSLRVEKAKCTRTNFVLLRCSIELRDAERDGKRHDVDFTVLFGSTTGEAVVPVRSNSDPDVVSVTSSLDRLGKRIFSWIVILLLILAVSAVVGSSLIDKLTNRDAGEPRSRSRGVEETPPGNTSKPE